MGLGCEGGTGSGGTGGVLCHWWLEGDTSWEALSCCLPPRRLGSAGCEGAGGCSPARTSAGSGPVKGHVTDRGYGQSRRPQLSTAKPEIALGGGGEHHRGSKLPSTAVLTPLPSAGPPPVTGSPARPRRPSVSPRSSLLLILTTHPPSVRPPGTDMCGAARVARASPGLLRLQVQGGGWQQLCGAPHHQPPAAVPHEPCSLLIFLGWWLQGQVRWAGQVGNGQGDPPWQEGTGCRAEQFQAPGQAACSGGNGGPPWAEPT